MPHSALSTAIGDYLKAIWIVGQGDRATTSALAEHLSVSASSVSGMLARLQGQGWVTYERYKGATLTERGAAEALRLLRRHRLIETFLIDYLGYTWDEVHEEAEALEHAISDRFTERLAERLGHPTHDPHGDPIPTRRGGLPRTPDLALDELAVGDHLRVARLRTQDASLLAHLDALRIRPGQLVTVVHRVPEAGVVHVLVEGNEAVLSQAVAGVVRGARGTGEGT
ncbi:MAG: metal-dependent transcriptional regulator [Trueperaceae bacterium]